MNSPVARTDPGFLAVARGDAEADLLITNARVVNVFSREVLSESVALFRGRIVSVGSSRPARRTIDANNSYLAPGLIDAHMHVESTQMLPSQFVRVAAPHGTTGVVFDPHEIANVLGISGIRYLMDDARDLPMHIMFTASSCVPASPLESSGAELSAIDLQPLFDDDRVVALAEMMNFPGVVHANPDVLEKVRLGLARRIVDGHSPGLSGPPLQTYVAAGISSDHECTTAEEAREKLRLGMQIYIREGSAARNVQALLPMVTPQNAHRFCFCTDDRHPADLLNEGHIDHVLRKAISLGLDPVTAICMATLHTARHYRLTDIGAISPGHFADCFLFDDLRDIRPRMVFCRGELIAKDGTFLGKVPSNRDVHQPDNLLATVRLPPAFDESSLRINSPAAQATIRVIGMDPHQLVTEHLQMSAKIERGQVVSDMQRDILKLAVIERHHRTGNIGLGFVRGFKLQQGALASTVGHDSHNLTIVGTNDYDMVAAARALERAGGGQCVAKDGEILAMLPLPLAGIISDQSADALSQQQHALHQASHVLGCPLDDPFMPLSFLPLSVIPKLKLSDRGVVDVDRFQIVSLFASRSSLPQSRDHFNLPG